MTKTESREKTKELLELLSRLRAEKQVLDLREKALFDKISKAEKDLQVTCLHEETEQTSKYYSGSYDEVARTYYSIRCKCCDKVLKSWDKGHGYYG